MTRLCPVLVALVPFCLSLLYPPVFAETSSHLSQDPQVNQARTLINKGQHQAALEILRPLATDTTNIAIGGATRADITDIRFLIGLSAIAVASQRDNQQQKIVLLREAIAAFHAILIDRPELTRVRLELARAFFLKGDDALSQTHFERILAGNPPAAMVANIRRFLSAMRARRRWNGYFSINLERNDNLNSGSETKVIYLFGLPFTLNPDSRPQSGTGIAFAGGREYQHPLGARWRWRFGADATHSEYRGHESDQTWLSLRSGPRWLLSRRSDVGLQAVVGQRWLAGNRHSSEFGLRFNARHQLNRQLGINARVSWKKTAALGERQTTTPDAINVEYALGGNHLFSPLLQGSAGIGFSHAHPQPKRPHSGSRSRNFNLGLSKILPRGWTVGGNLEWSRQRHGNNVPCHLLSGNTGACLQQRQLDRKRTARLFLLNRGLTFFGFSPQFIVTQERQQSNSVLRTYQRTRVDLRFVQQF